MDSKKQTTLNNLLDNTGDMALKRRARKILTTIDPQPGDKILDLGCGDGYYLHMISELGVKNIKLYGSDFDREALKTAKKNLKSKKIQFKFGDLMKKLPYKSNTFDKIVMSEVAEHLPDDLKGLKEVYRVLKPGGRLAITVPNANYPLLWDPINKVLEFLFDYHVKSGFFAGLWNMHERLYEENQLVSVLKKAGFKIKQQKSLTYWCIPFNHYIVNATAIAIHSGKLDKSTKAALNKFEKNPKRPLLINLAFYCVNLIDNLNDYLPIKNHGVGVFVEATK